jgi:hypothetical protein
MGMGVAALLAALLVLAKNLVRGSGKNVAMLVLCLAMIAGYLAVIAAGRINIQGEFGLRVGLYYPYNFLTLLLVAFALLSSDQAAASKMPDKLVKVIAACVMAMVVVSYTLMTHKVTAQMARDHAQSRIFLAALDRYVKAHEKEPGFSFYVGPEYPGNYTPDWVSRRGDPAGRHYTVAEALYLPQFTRHNPKYVIKFER